MHGAVRRIAVMPICLAVAAMAGAAPPRTFDSAFYRVTTNVPLSRALEVSQHMDAVYAEYLRWLPSFKDDLAGRVDLYLTGAQEDYIATMAGVGVSARHTGGIFYSTPAGEGLATWLGARSERDMLRTLQHEGFHQFAHLRIGRLMPWVNEGLAEFFGDGLLVGRRLQTGMVDPARLDRILDGLRSGMAFGTDELVSMSQADWNARVLAGDPRAGLMYDQAWSIVHMLIIGGNGGNAPRLEEYLRRVARDVDPREAFTGAFGDDPVDFENTWRQYVRSLEADPVSSALQRMDFMAMGLRWLYEQKVRVQTVDELRSLMQRAEFRVRSGGHGFTSVMTSADEESFRPPVIPRRAGRAEMTFDPDRSAEVPPSITMSGFGFPTRSVTLRWVREPGDGLTYRFEFR